MFHKQRPFRLNSLTDCLCIDTELKSKFINHQLKSLNSLTDCLCIDTLLSLLLGEIRYSLNSLTDCLCIDT